MGRKALIAGMAVIVTESNRSLAAKALKRSRRSRRSVEWFAGWQLKDNKEVSCAD
jgi:hypothetical protein